MLQRNTNVHSSIKLCYHTCICGTVLYIFLISTCAIYINVSFKTEPSPKYVKINISNEEAMYKVKYETKSSAIYNKLNKNQTVDRNFNYEIIYEEILQAKNKHMPTKLVKCNKYKHKKSTWITQGLIKSIRYRDCIKS